jgi:hypothetical protein
MIGPKLNRLWPIKAKPSMPLELLEGLPGGNSGWQKRWTSKIRQNHPS